MAKQNWFRKTSWTAEDQSDFWKRFARARPASRAQYLRVQADHLAAGGDPTLTTAALDLLDKLLTEYPDRVQTAAAHWQRGQALAGLGQIDEAIEAYRASMNAERAFPNVRTLAFLDFAELALANERTGTYAEVGALLDEFANEPTPFPVVQFRVAAAHAQLAVAGGDVDAARVHAMDALSHSEIRQAPLRYHRDLGLVGEKHETTRALMMRLADRLQ